MVNSQGELGPARKTSQIFVGLNYNLNLELLLAGETSGQLEHFALGKLLFGVHMLKLL
jgi:hypothetical protein